MDGATPTSPQISIEENVNQKNYITDLTQWSSTKPIYLQTNAFTLTVNGIPQGDAYDLTVKQDDNPKPIIPTAPGGTTSTFSVTNLSPGQATLTITKKEPPTAPVADVNIVVPDNTSPPEILRARNGDHGDGTNLTGIPDPAVNVYDGKLTLEGINNSSRPDLNFGLFVKGENGKYARDPRWSDFLRSHSEAWQRDLKLPPNVKEAHLVLFSCSSDNSSSRSSKQIKLTIYETNATVLSQQSAAQILSIDGEGTKVVDDVPVINSKSFQLRGDVDLLNVGDLDTSSLLSDTFLLVFLDGNPKPLKVVSLQDAGAESPDKSMKYTF